MSDSSVYTGFYPDFKDIPQDQKDKVNAVGEKKKKRNKGKNPHQVS